MRRKNAGALPQGFREFTVPALLTHNYFGGDVLRRINDGDMVADNKVSTCDGVPACDNSVSACTDDALTRGDDPSVRIGVKGVSIPAYALFNRPNGVSSPLSLREVFLLGNQGPDPFFYVLRAAPLIRIKKFGSLMHHEETDRVLEAFRRLAISMPEPERNLLLAYLLGFACHFTLDSIMHPFVYAQQYAFCDAGVKGLDRRDGSIVHGQIEADLDMMLLRQRRGEGIRNYDYTREILKVDEGVLRLLDAAYEALAHEVYAIDLPTGAFSQSVRDMRLTIAFLYSPRGIKRKFIGRIERLLRRHSFAQAMSPRNDVGITCDFDNHEQNIWKNPFTDEVSHTSFDELYVEALNAALDNISALLDGKPTAIVTKGLDFEGTPCL
ncbi:MAG: zinc dependent phospholipase C family protein [Coriobacteriales bacterium]|jgi:hypothetical protein|nr:zinc dependent phospholipase C family protein [Coriobacteriales bacterium]